jgi:hypothetical protein
LRAAAAGENYRLSNLYRFESEAQSRANRLMRWLEGKLKAIGWSSNRYRNQVEMGHVGRIDYYRRFGLVNDFTGIVVGWSEVPAKGQVTLVLIGPSP